MHRIDNKSVLCYNTCIESINGDRMTMLNFQLFENFKEAAKKSNLPVIPGQGHHTIKLSNGRYIYCWTPLNKMFQLYNYYEDKDWDRALKYLENNFSDFHLEVGGDSVEDMNIVTECFWDVCWDKDITVNQIIEIIEILSDDEKINKKLVWMRLTHGAEE